MNTTFFKKEAPIWVVLALPVVLLLVMGDQLPARVPIHWNAQGEVDGYGSPYWLPALNVGLYLLLLLVPKINPRKRNYALFQDSYYKLRFVIAVFLTGLTVTILLNGLGYDINVAKVVGLSVLLLLALIGNYLSTIRPNWFMGIRTPWTLSSDAVWKQTHQLVGKGIGPGSVTFTLLVALLFMPTPALATVVVQKFIYRDSLAPYSSCSGRFA